MPYLVVNSGRMVQKIVTNTGTPFAVAPSANHTDGSWSPNHLYDGEIGLNTPLCQFAVRISGAIRYAPLVATLGTSGQVLSSNGPGLPASWVTNSGGGGSGGTGATTFGALTDAYALSGTDYLVPMTNAAGTALIPVNIFEGVVISVDAATTAALPAVTYNNGASGVGATLTANANGAFPTIDGVAAVLNQTYLVKNQVAKLQNGAYQLTTLGTGGAPFILTRLTNSDATSELDAQGVVVAGGTANGKRTFSQQTPSPVVGTDAISYKRGPSGSMPVGVSGQTLRYNVSDVLVSDSLLTNDGTSVGIGTTSPGGRLDILTAASSTGIAFSIRNSGPTTLFQILENGTWALGLNAGTPSTLAGPTDVSINAVISGGGVNRTAINGSVTGYYGIAIGGIASSDANIAIGYGATAGGNYAAVAIGMNMVTSANGAMMIGNDYNATVTNNITRSLMFSFGGYNSGALHKQSFFINHNSNIVLNQETDLTSGTHFDPYATNTVTVFNGSKSGARTITSVSNSSGKAAFNSSAVADLRQGDKVVTSGFGVYNNQTYWVGAGLTTLVVFLYPTQADAIAGTSAVNFISTDTGTITPQSRAPEAAITNASQVFSSGGKLSALNGDGETGKVILGGNDATLGVITTPTIQELTPDAGITVLGTGGVNPLLTLTGTDTISIFVYQGDPNSQVTANRGSLYIDKAAGDLYIKTTNSGDTGWEAFTH